MSTRGAYGYRINSKNYVTYNHFDSMPDSLGEVIGDFVQKMNRQEGWDRFKKNAARVSLVDEQKKPNSVLVERYRKYSNVKVGNQNIKDWYCLFRELQYGAILTEIFAGQVEHMIDNQEFFENPLFCEYAYILDLDTNKLECYSGFCLVGEIPFADVTKESVLACYSPET